MNQRRLALLGLFAGIFAAGSTASVVNAQVTPAVAPASSGATHIAVVNLRLAVATIQETQDAQKTLAGLQDQFDVKQRADQRELKDAQDKMNQNVKPGTLARDEAMRAYDDMTLRFNSEEQTLKIQMVRTQARELKNAYDEVKATVTDIAKKRGIDLVLIDSGQEVPINAGDISNGEQLVNLIFNRSVMYAGAGIDLTQEVITSVDAAHKQATAPKPPAGH